MLCDEELANTIGEDGKGEVIEVGWASFDCAVGGISGCGVRFWEI